MTVEQQPRRVTITTPTDQEIHFERIFDAPRDVVWSAFTDPALIAEWWGGGTKVEKMDLRTGGSWRFIAENRDGRDYVFQGQYLQVSPPERIVQTMENGWMEGLTWTEAMEFEDIDGKQTRFTQTSIFDTVEKREMVLVSAEVGANYTYLQLDKVLARLTGGK